MPLKPLILKTYGKQRRKLSAWISPENRKQAFDSSLSTDGDISVFEPPRAKARTRKTSVASHRALRPAKKKAMLCLSEKSLDEDNIPSPCFIQAAQQSKTTRNKKTSGSSDRAVHPSKRKAGQHLKTSSDENISRPSSARPIQQSKTTRKSCLVSAPRALIRQKGQNFPRTSESEEESSSTANCQRNSVQTKTDSDVNLPSASRFVTRRRRVVAAKPKLPKPTFGTLNSSDDFTSGGFVPSKTLQPSRRKRVPSAFEASNAESSEHAAEISSFATNPFREISLNELADPSNRLRPRAPIFCSTPSAGLLCKRPRLKPLSINDQSASSPSKSVSRIGVSSTFHEVLDSPVQPVSPQPTGLRSEEKLQPSFGEQEPPGDLFETKRTNERSTCSEEAKSHSEDIKIKNDGESRSLNLFSASDTESSSHFVSAAGGLEWLTEALKERCLTQPCTVQLKRLYNLSATQLCSQTTYSSCLGHSSSVHSRQTNKHPQSAETSFNLHLSVTTNRNSGYLHSVTRIESPDHAASVTDSQSANNSPSVDCNHSLSKEPMEHSASVLYDESTHHTEDSVEFIMGTHLPTANSPMQALFTEEEAAAGKDKSLAQRCSVQLQKLDESQKLKEAGLSCNASRSENDGTQIIDDPQAGEKLTMLKTMLMEKSLNDKLKVRIKKLSASQLKEILQHRHTKLNSHTDAVVKSHNDNQTETHNQSETDADHRNDNVAAMKVDIKKRGSTSSEDKIDSAKAKVVKNWNIPHKTKKTSLAPREKKTSSMATDRPGTSRKACVSGLSVNRWKNKGNASMVMFRSRTAQRGSNTTEDCSIIELIKQPKELLDTTMNFSTPMKASRLNLSSLLTDFTPGKHTWSRLKAALSVHRKVLLTPKTPSLRVSGFPGRAQFADVSQDLFASPFRSSLPKRLQSQLRDSHVECEDADLSDAEKVYAECGQQCPLPWEEGLIPHCMKRCVKIGEGTFGEVFSSTKASGDTVALKIIPVEGSEQVNGEDQKTFGEILHEIIISKELSSLKGKQQNQTLGFIGLNNLHCVRGCYPPDFLNAWDAFDQQKGSENDRPDFFKKDQLFIILEFEFGGKDLENCNGTLTSLVVAKSVLHQVTAALAVAEQELHFEHRDLHWGNVLVKTTKEKKGRFLLNGAAHSFETKGVLVRIIDYSLSRLEIDDLTVSCDISKDEELFMGHGDYQFDIYRLMRQENGNNWSDYHPHSNILWLHYLCSKLLTMKYRCSGGRAAKDTREALTRFHDDVLQYSSATEALQTCPMFQ